MSDTRTIDATTEIKPAKETIGHADALFVSQPPDGPDRGKAGQTVGSETLGEGRNLDTIMRIPVNVQVVLGAASMPVASLMKLGRGAVVALDHRVGEPVDVVVNGRVVARGEVVVVEEDNSRFGVSLTEIVGTNSDGKVA
jgi:flagellar motor switch protein FliN/FliY